METKNKILTKEGINKLTERIIGLAIEVHKNLGPGFIERIYEQALVLELLNNRINFEPQKVIDISYKGTFLGKQQIDLIVENEIIVELKAVNEINNIHIAQLLSYLKAMERRVGLVLNFARETLEIKRVVNNF